MESGEHEAVEVEQEALPAVASTIVWTVIYLVWAIVGVFVGIPAVVAGILLYVAGVFSAAIAKDSGLLPASSRFLRTSVNFYGQGFNRLRAIRSGERLPAKEDQSAASALISLLFVSVLALTLSAVFWYALLRLGAWLWAGARSLG